MTIRLYVDGNRTHQNSTLKALEPFDLDVEVVQTDDHQRNGQFLNAARMDLIGMNDVPLLMVLNEEGVSKAFLENVHPGGNNHEKLSGFLKSQRLIA